MSQIGLIPFYRAVDTNGNPMPNCRLYTFLTGTTTPQAVYTADDLVTSHGAYVQADANGLFPPFYPDPTKVYRYQLRVSPYAAAVSGCDADPITSLTSSGISFIQGSSGAVAVTVQEKLRRIVDIEDYGGGTGVTDNTAAMIDALTALDDVGGGLLVLQAGNYNFASAALLADGGIQIPANVAITGKGIGITSLTVTGSTACPFFLNETGVSDILIENLTARGNSTASNSRDGNFLYVAALSGDTDITADVVNIVVRNVRLENFGGDRWCAFVCTHATYKIIRCGLDQCQAKSEAGNCRNAASIGVPTRVCEFYGQGGEVRDCFVLNLIADLDYIKGGVVCYGRVKNTQIIGGVLRNTFVSVGTSDVGAYALTLYDLTTTDIVDGTVIKGVAMIAPYSAGVYVAGTLRTRIESCIVSGTADTAEGTLMKGAYVFLGPIHARLVGCLAQSCVGSIRLSGPSDDIYHIGVDTTFDDMDFQVIGGSGYLATTGVSILPGLIATAVYSGGVTFTGYREIDSRTNALTMRPSLTRGIQKVSFVDCDFSTDAVTAASVAVDMNKDAAATPLLKDILWRGGRVIRCGSTGYSFSLGGTNAGVLILDAITFEAAAAYHVVLGASTKVRITDLRFEGVPSSGFCMELSGTQGHLEGCKAASGVLCSTTGTALGEAVPGWTGWHGCYVQNSQPPALAGAASPNAYRMKGWSWRTGTTWDEDRSGLI